MKTKYMYVADGKRINISQYPSIHKSGSVYGMKRLYWGRECFTVKCGSWIYKVPKEIYDMAH